MPMPAQNPTPGLLDPQNDWDTFDPPPPRGASPTLPKTYVRAPTPLDLQDEAETAAASGAPTALDLQDQAEWDAFDPAPPVAAVAAPRSAPRPVSAPQGVGYSPYSAPNAEDAYNFLRTAVTKAAAGIVGIPHAIDDLGEYLRGKTGVGADARKSPFFQATPTADQAADTMFQATAPEYQPQTTAGQYGMDAATFAAPAILDPATIIPNALPLPQNLSLPFGVSPGVVHLSTRSNC